MKTLKKATAFALSLALGLSLTACSNGGTSSQSSTSGQDGSGSVDWPTKANQFCCSLERGWRHRLLCPYIRQVFVGGARCRG